MATVDFSRENLSTLVKDGISDELYKLLWAKDELNFGPSVNMPDTIIYKYGQPVTWYFTSVNGRIKKKNKQNLLSAKIEEVFNKHVLGYDVIAYFITMTSEHERSANDSSPTVIEYFDRAALNNFLYNHKKGVNGILQRFIEPKSTHNEMIRAIWSPKLCLFERAENIHQLHDHRYGLYERCVVYEGPDYYFTSAPLRGPVLSGQLQKLSEAIIHHISEVTYGQKQVTRIVLNFKVDSRDKIWLLYSTSIRCDDMLDFHPKHEYVERNLLNIDSVVSLPETVTLNPQKTYNKIVPKVRVACLSCNTETLDELRYPVTYKSVIKHYDHVVYLLRSTAGTTAAVLSNTGSISTAGTSSMVKGMVVPWPPDADLIAAAGGVGFGCLAQDDDKDKDKSRHHHVKYKSVKDVAVPPMIAALHPKLNAETYLRCKTDPLFQNKTLHVCESCYLVYAEFSTMMLRMGGSLTKLLGSGESTAPPTAHTSTTFERPSSADWRAISTAMSQSRVDEQASLSRAALQHQEDAKARAIGLRSSDMRFQPEVPSPIRSGSESQLLTRSVYTADDSMMTASPFKGGLLDLGSQSLHEQVNGYTDEHLQAMIADRERKFFKEVSLNPQLKDQHPLMHLITAQQRLQLVDQQSGVLMSKAASAMESVFPAKYGHQSTDKHQKYGPYGAELPYAVNGEIVLPSTLRQRKARELADVRSKKKESLAKFMQADEEALAAKERHAEQVRGSGDSVTEGSVKSSKQYRDFLAESLQKIEAELGEAVGYAPMLDEVSDSKSKQSNSLQSSKRKVSSVASKRSTVRNASDANRPVATAPALSTPAADAIPYGIAMGEHDASDETDPDAAHMVIDSGEAPYVDTGPSPHVHDLGDDERSLEGEDEGLL